MSMSDKKWPGDCEEAYPEVYNTPPPFPDQLKPGQLNREHFTQFFSEGFLVIDEFFTADEIEVLDKCKETITQEVDKVAQRLYKAGKIKHLYADKGLFERMTLIDKEFPGANILLHKLGVLPESFQQLFGHPKLLNLAEQLLGTKNINGSPVWNLRVKTPNTEAATEPWHQDNGYDSNSMYDKFVLTGWIPLLNAKENNGCLQMARYGHRSGRVATHQCCWGGTWYVQLDEQQMNKTLGVNLDDDIVTCPVPYGGMVIFNNMVPHRSLNNVSSDVRWSLDLRWVSGDTMTSFHGLKDSIELRSASDPDMKPDWDKFNEVVRTEVQEENMGMHLEEFDTVIVGPWMKKWEMIHMNRHTTAFTEQEAEGVTMPVYAP